MRSGYRGLSFYRPRALTILASALVVAIVALANLSVDPEWHSGHIWQKAYGWPLIWHRYVAVGWEAMAEWRTVGWFYSPARLAANVAMWAALVVGTSVACEWLLRRYGPRLRFSLRAMLAAVGLVAALCGWFVFAKRRADLQDQVFAQAPRAWGGTAVKFQRWGPRWLDLVGADRYARSIVACGFPFAIRCTEERDGLLTRLAGLPSLRYLGCDIERFTPGIAATINDMRHLRYLSIERVFDYKNEKERYRQEYLPPVGELDRLEELHLRNLSLDSKSLVGLPRLKSLSLMELGYYQDAEVAHECLVAIGNATGLEYVDLYGVKIRGESLAHLAALVKLKSLTLSSIRSDAPSLLSHLPRLPRLENLDIRGSSVGDHDLGCLAALPRLRSLGLSNIRITATGVATLASLESLEELALSGDMISPEVLRSLCALNQLKTLRLYRDEKSNYGPFAKVMLDNGKNFSVPERQVEAFRRELRAFRQARPAVVIEADLWRIDQDSLFDETLEDERDADWFPAPAWLPKSDWAWLTASEHAEFQARGGRATFDAASWEGQTVSF